MDWWFVRASAGSNEVGWRFPSRGREGCHAGYRWGREALHRRGSAGCWAGEALTDVGWEVPKVQTIVYLS